VPDNVEELVLANDSTRLRSFIVLDVAVTSKPVRDEKVLTPPVIFTELRPG
jgi:hypothetical protein